MHVYKNNSSGNIAVVLDELYNTGSSKGWFYFRESDLKGYCNFFSYKDIAEMQSVSSCAHVLNALNELELDFEKFAYEGENENMKSEKILGLWKKAGMEYVEEETAKEEGKLALADATYVQLLKHVAEIDRIVSECGHNEDGRSCVNDCKRFVSNETKQKIRWARSKASTKKSNLNGLVDEIAAMLSACDTYEQEMDVLRTYDVIDEDGRLNKILSL